MFLSLKCPRYIGLKPVFMMPGCRNSLVLTLLTAGFDSDGSFYKFQSYFMINHALGYRLQLRELLKTLDSSAGGPEKTGLEFFPKLNMAITASMLKLHKLSL